MSFQQSGVEQASEQVVGGINNQGAFSGLKHVDVPSAAPSERVKEAFIADQAARDAGRDPNHDALADAHYDQARGHQFKADSASTTGEYVAEAAKAKYHDLAGKWEDKGVSQSTSSSSSGSSSSSSSVSGGGILESAKAAGSSIVATGSSIAARGRDALVGLKDRVFEGKNDRENAAFKQAKERVVGEINQGNFSEKLKHVDAPSDAPSTLIREAFIADRAVRAAGRDPNYDALADAEFAQAREHQIKAEAASTTREFLAEVTKATYHDLKGKWEEGWFGVASSTNSSSSSSSGGVVESAKAAGSSIAATGSSIAAKGRDALVGIKDRVVGTGSGEAATVTPEDRAHLQHLDAQNSSWIGSGSLSAGSSSSSGGVIGPIKAAGSSIAAKGHDVLAGVKETAWGSGETAEAKAHQTNAEITPSTGESLKESAKAQYHGLKGEGEAQLGKWDEQSQAAQNRVDAEGHRAAARVE